jgi:hypothetical protein
LTVESSDNSSQFAMNSPGCSVHGRNGYTDGLELSEYEIEENLAVYIYDVMLTWLLYLHNI